LISGRDIICLSTQDWTDLWTRKQRFMREFARQGNRVLYVETQASLISASLLRSDIGRAWRWLSGPRPVEPNLYVATLPLVLPAFQMSLAINAVNNALLAPLVRRWLSRLQFRDAILWTYTPYSESLVGRLGEQVVIYDCVDEVAASRGLVKREVVEELERRLLRKTAVTIVTHEALQRSKSGSCGAVHLVPNGAELEHFAAAAAPATAIAPAMAALPRPLIGFIGSVQYWIDFDLLRFLATSRPHWSFALIGPVGRMAEVSKLADLPNVHLFGRQPYADLPSYVKAFDVCLNPYIVGEVAANCSPLKLYEYLASGKPIVSVDMPAAADFEDVVSIGRTYAEVLAQIDRALATPDPDGRLAAARMAAATPHSWTRRFSALESAIAPYLATASR
jgi:glycosyltransferase involved in cell wall biosynthesis